MDSVFQIFKNVGSYDFYVIFAFFILVGYNMLNYSKKKALVSGLGKRLHAICVNKVKCSLLSFLKKDNFWIFVEIYVISCVQYLPALFFNKWFGMIVGTGANYFGLLYFVPFVVLIFCLLIRVDPLKQMDLLAPAYPLALVFAKIGCYNASCCASFDNSIPIQMIEAIVAMLLFFFLRFYKGKAKEGTIFPTYLISYSITRFFTEFLRNESDILGPLKKYHFLCITGIILGIIELYLVSLYRNKVNEFKE